MLTTLLVAALLSDPPRDLSGHAGTAVADRIYVVGGMPWSNTGSFFKTLWEIDPRTNSWKALPDMHEGRGMAAAAELNGSIYVAGGMLFSGAAQRTVERFDLAKRTWTNVAPMKRPRTRFSLLALDGKLYAVSGLADQDGNITSIEEYDPTRNAWHDAGDLRQARHGFGAVAWHGAIYVFGGYSGDMSATCERWDPKSGRASELPPMPAPRGFHGALIWRNKIVCIGGRAVSTHPVEFDPSSTKWRELPVADIDLNRFVAGVIGGKIWTVGGESRALIPIVRSVDIAGGAK